MLKRIGAIAAISMLVIAGGGGTGRAQESCSRVVIFTLPGVTWEEVERVDPPNLQALVDSGAMGSMSVRTNSSRTTYASGFATIGAGTRMDGGFTTGGVAAEGRGIPVAAGVRAAGLAELRATAAEDGYDAVPGALAEAAASIPTVAIGNADVAVEPRPPIRPAKWPLLAAMDAEGIVDLAVVDDSLLVESAGRVRTDGSVIEMATRTLLEPRCRIVVIDQGDLIRTEILAGTGSPTFDEREEALLAADELLGVVEEALSDEDLLLAVAPTSPLADTEVHFGIAVARGPGFDAGDSLTSASTRRTGIVTLPDVAPTVLEHLGLERHPAMLGRAMSSVDGGSGDLVAHAIESDREAVFIDRARAPVTTVFVVAQVVIYLLIWWLLARAGVTPKRVRKWSEIAVLAVVAFPVSTYLAGIVSQHQLGPWGYAGLLVGLDVLLIAIVSGAFRASLDRLLALTAFTCAVLIVDVLAGAPLQVNTAFSYSPLVAGRFAGFGNTAFSVLGAATVITGALIVHRLGGTSRAIVAAAALFLVVIAVDGAPMWGSDIGGVLALVPGFGITLMLLMGRRPTAKGVVLCIVATVVIVGAFLAFDLSRPSDSRTHLARLYEDVRARGGGVFLDTIGRKIETNLRVFTGTIWTYLVPPALGLIVWLLLRPKNRWGRLATEYPTLRAGLVGGLLLSVLGFAVNDSGIVVPAVMLSYLVPVAFLAHLLLEREVV